MESALYSIYALVVFVSEILLVRCAHSFDFWHVNNSCVNTARQHFPWSILYLFDLFAPANFAWPSWALQPSQEKLKKKMLMQNWDGTSKTTFEITGWRKN